MSRKRVFNRRRLSLESLEDRTLFSAISFSAPANYPVGYAPNSVKVGDFNGDGRPDLAVANLNSDTVSVLLGNRDGTFQTAKNFAAGIRPSSVAVGDFNGDGKPDLATANADYGGSYVSVLLGNGDGTLQTARSFATGGLAYSIAVGDFNGDGRPDLTVANQDTNTVSVLLGNGDGTFQTAQNFAAGLNPTFVAVGDFNGDGKPDLVVTNNYSPGISYGLSVLLGDGDGTFQAAQNFGVGNGPSSVTVADFNGDGKADLAVANISSSSDTVSVLLGNGNGTFQTAQNFATGRGPYPLAVGDFNSDGKLDLAVGNIVTNNVPVSTVSVLLGNGDGTFQNAQNFATDFGPDSMAVGDFNGDGKLDLVTANAYGSSVSVLLSQLVTTTAVSGPVSSTYAQSITYTATVLNGTSPMTAGTVIFQDGDTPISAALPLSANGQVAFSIASLNVGSHTISAIYSGMPDGTGTSTGFGTSTGTAALMVNPVALFCQRRQLQCDGRGALLRRRRHVHQS